MNEITVKNFQGKEFSGKWNGKTYPSKIEGRPELHRIYVNDKEIHITDEELHRIINEIQGAENKNEETTMQIIMKMFDGLTEENKRRVVNALMNQYTEKKRYDLSDEQKTKIFEARVKWMEGTANKQIVDLMHELRKIREKEKAENETADDVRNNVEDYFELEKQLAQIDPENPELETSIDGDVPFVEDKEYKKLVEQLWSKEARESRGNY
jgi:hypothetical protein